MEIFFGAERARERKTKPDAEKNTTARPLTISQAGDTRSKGGKALNRMRSPLYPEIIRIAYIPVMHNNSKYMFGYIVT